MRVRHQQRHHNTTMQRGVCVTVCVVSPTSHHFAVCMLKVEPSVGANHHPTRAHDQKLAKGVAVREPNRPLVLFPFRVWLAAVSIE